MENYQVYELFFYNRNIIIVHLNIKSNIIIRNKLEINQSEEKN